MIHPLIEYGRKGIALPESIPVFDCHAHLVLTGRPAALTLGDQISEMNRLGIKLAAISSSLAIDGDVHRGNDQVAEALRRFPDRLVGYCHVGAALGDQMVPELKRCFALRGFRGIKVYQQGTSYDHALFDPVWEYARRRKTPVLAHTWAGNLTGLDRAAEKNPEVPFLAAHVGSGAACEPYIEAARKCPNIYLDLTYSRENTGMIEHVVASVGSGRVVWGTDSPVFSMAHQLSKILFARIDDADKRKILYDTAGRLFGLIKE